MAGADEADTVTNMTTKSLSGGGRPVVLAVVGNRKFTSLRWREAATWIIRDAYRRLQPHQVISGGAYGVDTLAMRLAAAEGIPHEEYLPKHRRWKPEGFEDRNRRIAEACTHLVRIACEDATTYGSGWTADLAETLGRTVERYTILRDGSRRGG